MKRLVPSRPWVLSLLLLLLQQERQLSNSYQLHSHFHEYPFRKNNRLCTSSLVVKAMNNRQGSLIHVDRNDNYSNTNDEYDDVNRDDNVSKRAFQGASLVFDDDIIATAIANAQQEKKRATTGTTTGNQSSVQVTTTTTNTAAAAAAAITTAQQLDADIARQVQRSSSWNSIKETIRSERKHHQVDLYETMDLIPSQRIYSIIFMIIVTIAYGRATPQFVSMMTHNTIHSLSSSLSSSSSSTDTMNEMIPILQGMALGLFLTAIGSSIAAVFLAQNQNRSTSIWAIKGLLGGPFTVQQLRNLDPIIPMEESS
jgi:hypothetical protein